MNDTTVFWLGFCVGAVGGAVAIVFVVEFARWLLYRKRRH